MEEGGLGIAVDGMGRDGMEKRQEDGVECRCWGLPG